MNYSYFNTRFRKLMKASIIGAMIFFHAFTMVAMAFSDSSPVSNKPDENYEEKHDAPSGPMMEEMMIRAMSHETAMVEETKAKTEEDNPVLSDVPVCSTGRNKTYMDYRMINEASEQWKIITTMTEAGEDGFLYTEDGFIGVALGSYFGPLGSKFNITLDNGKVIKAIKVEAKADHDTIDGCYQKYDGSVVEFVIDEEKAEQYWGRSENGYINSGNFNNAEDFNGSIIKIEKVE